MTRSWSEVVKGESTDVDTKQVADVFLRLSRALVSVQDEFEDAETESSICLDVHQTDDTGQQHVADALPWLPQASVSDDEDLTSDAEFDCISAPGMASEEVEGEEAISSAAISEVFGRLARIFEVTEDHDLDDHDSHAWTLTGGAHREEGAGVQVGLEAKLLADMADCEIIADAEKSVADVFSRLSNALASIDAYGESDSDFVHTPKATRKQNDESYCDERDDSSSECEPLEVKDMDVLSRSFLLKRVPTPNDDSTSAGSTSDSEGESSCDGFPSRVKADIGNAKAPVQDSQVSDFVEQLHARCLV